MGGWGGGGGCGCCQGGGVPSCPRFPCPCYRSRDLTGVSLRCWFSRPKTSSLARPAHSRGWDGVGDALPGTGTGMGMRVFSLAGLGIAHDPRTRSTDGETEAGKTATYRKQPGSWARVAQFQPLAGGRWGSRGGEWDSGCPTERPTLYPRSAGRCGNATAPSGAASSGATPTAGWRVASSTTSRGSSASSPPSCCPWPSPST